MPHLIGTAAYCCLGPLSRGTKKIRRLKWSFSQVMTSARNGTCCWELEQTKHWAVGWRNANSANSCSPSHELLAQIQTPNNTLWTPGPLNNPLSVLTFTLIKYMHSKDWLKHVSQALICHFYMTAHGVLGEIFAPGLHMTCLPIQQLHFTAWDLTISCYLYSRSWHR